MASDAQDVLTELPDAASVTVILDDHHDSERINRGLAAAAGYRDTFGAEAERDLDTLRLTFRRKAHAAAMERALTALLRDDPQLTVEDLHGVTLGDLPECPATRKLVRCRAELGFGVDPADPVLVDEHGRPCAPAEVPFRLRLARSTRISIEGNAHFCRGLLRTRYPDADADKVAPANPSTTEAEAS